MKSRFPCRVAAFGPAVLAILLTLSTTAAGADRSAWQGPLAGSWELERGFDPPGLPWGPGHRGIDLAAHPGEPVYAAGRGRVLYAGMLAGRGVVSIVHGRLRTTYEPVRPSVRTGQTVTAGARIGVVGSTPGHCPPRTCLHWGLIRGSRYLDPLGLFGQGPIRLLPVWDIPTPYPAIRPERT